MEAGVASELHHQLEVYRELERAVQELSSRGLHTAARWAAEQLNGLDAAVLQAAAAALSAGQVPPMEPDTQDRHPLFMLARQHFEFKEYQRAAQVLAGVPGSKALFLRCYCRYLAGERTKEEEKAGQQGQASKGGAASLFPPSGVVGGSAAVGPVNKELDSLEAELSGCVASGEGDAFCAYLLGVVLLDKQRVSEAQDMLLLSLRSYPCNWAAWMALQRAVVSCSSLRSLPASPDLLPSHWATDFFLAATCLELQENSEALSRLQRLSQLLPASLGLEALVAQAHYNLQNYDEAQVVFEDLLSRDPHRLEGMDTFSNILFVKELGAPLSQLAHNAMATDRYRPETCCIVGNYYSLKGQHERAVEYFKRALRLQRTCLAAWTLMGHEYMELKNTAAAIEAYRHAVDLSPGDFRAWYGLGQAYELLRMPFYALYYYRRAASLRPTDARMWCALGQCYAADPVCNHEAAVRCYQRAIEGGDPDGVAVHSLAKLHQQRGDLDAAEQLYRTNLARLDQEAALAGAAHMAGGGGAAGAGGGPGGNPGAGGAQSVDAVEALLFLAERCKDTGRLAEAQAFCERLLDLGGHHRERAKALAREVHARMAAARSTQQELAVAAHQLLTAHQPLQQQQPQHFGGQLLDLYSSQQTPAGLGGGQGQQQVPMQGTPLSHETPHPPASGHAMEQTPQLVRHPSLAGQQGMSRQGLQHHDVGHRFGSAQELHTPSDLGASPGEGDEEEDDMMVSTPQT